MDKTKIKEIKQKIIEEVNRLGYSIDEENVVYDSFKSKEDKMIFVVRNVEEQIIAFEYNPIIDLLNQI